MSVSIESNNTCTVSIEKVTDIDNEICTNSPDSDPGRVGIEDNGEKPSTVDLSEGEVVLGETIFCRQVDMLTYVDYSEQESSNRPPACLRWSMMRDWMTQTRFAH